MLLTEEKITAAVIQGKGDGMPSFKPAHEMIKYEFNPTPDGGWQLDIRMEGQTQLQAGSIGNIIPHVSKKKRIYVDFTGNIMDI